MASPKQCAIRWVSSEGKLGTSMLLISAFPFLIRLDMDMMLQTKVKPMKHWQKAEATPRSADESPVGTSKLGRGLNHRCSTGELPLKCGWDENGNGEKYLHMKKGEVDWERGRSKIGQPSEKNTNLDRVYPRSLTRTGKPPMGITCAGLLIQNQRIAGVLQIDTDILPGEMPLLQLLRGTLVETGGMSAVCTFSVAIHRMSHQTCSQLPGVLTSIGDSTAVHEVISASRR
ncbi:hypothetical protein HAX54_050006 [Datura stramonium]|uniref:Uncharacterized protein n=1 Tax=Datura stramonium TaxID=4076 RepID=A0ABS8WPT8_DATST|nr:hypothetical protein [Datura stramonium]